MILNLKNKSILTYPFLYEKYNKRSFQNIIFLSEKQKFQIMYFKAYNTNNVFYIQETFLKQLHYQLLYLWEKKMIGIVEFQER